MDIKYEMQREMLRRCYSPKTIHTYSQCIKQFMKFCRKELKNIKKEDIKTYLERYITRGSAGNTINVHLNALKFLFEEILNKRLTLRISYSKTPKTLPVFLTREEIIKLFESAKNEKHCLILELIYSSGLRVGELVSLKAKDLDFERNIGWVRSGKGKKDRPFIIARCLDTKLKSFVEQNCESLNSYIFSGRNKGKLHIRSIQQFIKDYAKKAGIEKNIHPHSLRHSFATHLIENGYDVACIQPLLGHNSAETTLRYVHMANPRLLSIISPYDTLLTQKGEQSVKCSERVLQRIPANAEHLR